MANLIAGQNDLKTKFPEIAKEADGWDPSTLLPGSSKKMPWKCSAHKHTWETSPNKRTSRGDKCPFCSNKKVWSGFNDLKTKYPEIAKEANGWDPSKILPGCNTKMSWKCSAHGHIWDALPNSRTRKKSSGCPFCSNHLCWSGFNDLKTKYPKIAKEANGWDPSKILPGCNTNMSWQCSAHKHTWETSPNKRTSRGDKCPFCSNKKVWSGFNDLKTRSPEIAKEADGWDPSMVMPGCSKIMAWQCQKGHTFTTSPNSRTSQKSKCPYCSNNLVWSGFNDLQTKFPEIAKEADGWDPSMVLPHHGKKKQWKCPKGHTWITTPDSRTHIDGNKVGTGCPECEAGGFNPGEPAWFYLMQRPGEQQIGITNNLEQRIKVHGSVGWVEIESIGPHPGKKILELENILKGWLKKEIGLVPDKTENWYTSKMEVHSLAELKEKSGVETSFF